ncbi:MAG: hypothetical protein KBG84_15685 [Planctomycetes bacterium]|nr:hypothetical protein [Planctomycetota bacterium]
MEHGTAAGKENWKREEDAFTDWWRDRWGVEEEWEKTYFDKQAAEERQRADGNGLGIGEENRIEEYFPEADASGNGPRRWKYIKARLKEVDGKRKGPDGRINELDNRFMID